MKKVLIFMLSLVMMVSAAFALASCDPAPQTGEIKLELNGGSINVEFNGNFTVGDEIALPTDITKEFFVFAGWYSDAELKTKVDNNFKPTAGGDITLYAKYTDTVDLEYNNLEGATYANAGEYTTSFLPGEDVVLPEVSKEGFDFIGWFFDSDYKEEATLEAIEARTYFTRLYARFGREVVLTYELGTGAKFDNEEYTKSFWYGDFPATEIVIPTVSKTDAVLMGWYTDAEFKSPIQVDTIKALNVSETLYARFVALADLKTVTYDHGGLTIRAPKYTTEDHTLYFAPGDKGLKLPGVEDMDDNKFLGWFKDADFTQPATAADIEAATDSITIYGKWTGLLATQENCTSSIFSFSAKAPGYIGDSLKKNDNYVTFRFVATKDGYLEGSTNNARIRIRGQYYQKVNEIAPLYFKGNDIYNSNDEAKRVKLGAYTADKNLVIDVVLNLDFAADKYVLEYYVGGQHVAEAKKEGTIVRSGNALATENYYNMCADVNPALGDTIAYFGQLTGTVDTCKKNVCSLYAGNIYDGSASMAKEVWSTEAAVKTTVYFLTNENLGTEMENFNTKKLTLSLDLATAGNEDWTKGSIRMRSGWSGTGITTFEFHPLKFSNGKMTTLNGAELAVMNEDAVIDLVVDTEAKTLSYYKNGTLVVTENCANISPTLAAYNYVEADAAGAGYTSVRTNLFQLTNDTGRKLAYDSAKVYAGSLY